MSDVLLTTGSRQGRRSFDSETIARTKYEYDPALISVIVVDDPDKSFTTQGSNSRPQDLQCSPSTERNIT